MSLRAAALLFVAVSGGCQEVARVTALRGKAMGTSYTIKVVLPAKHTENSVHGEVGRVLAEFNEVFSTYDPKSEISRFNAHATFEPFPASAEFRRVVERALSLAERTNGAFDPTIGPVLRLYGFGPGAKKSKAPPADAALAAAREYVSWKLLFVAESGHLHKDEPRVELDLNAIAKGTGVDVVAKTLDELGCESYMVEIGGEVRCRGKKPDGKAWRLGVALPSAPMGEYADKVDLIDRAMATSGSYMQFRNFDKRRVHHIVDPRTGRNATSNVVSVTVIAKTCELADCLATALMVLGPDEGEKVLARFIEQDVKALFLIDGAQGIERRAFRW